MSTPIDPSKLKPSDLTPAMQEYLLLVDRITRMTKTNYGIYFTPWAIGRQQTSDALLRRGLLSLRIGCAKLCCINSVGMKLAAEIRRERQETER